MYSLPDMNELIKIASSPAGQKLLAILQNSPEVDFKKLSKEISSGNLTAAKNDLSGILATDDVQKLLKQLEQQYE